MWADGSQEMTDLGPGRHRIELGIEALHRGQRQRPRGGLAVDHDHVLEAG